MTTFKLPALRPGADARPTVRRTPDTVTTLYGPDGSPINQPLPTVFLTPDEAALVRVYMSTLMRAQLEPEFFCRTCGHDTRDRQAQFTITDTQIAIACACSVLYHQGPTPPALLRPVSLVRVTSTTVPEGAIRTVPITVEAAKLLRSWKTFLQTHGLLEVLRCNPCFEANRSDGCHASVTAQRVEIRCRCTDRRFTGSTL